VNALIRSSGKCGGAISPEKAVTSLFVVLLFEGFPMDPRIALIISLTLYKAICICSGTIFSYLGYRLFMIGIWGNAGTLQAAYKDNKLLLKGAAPGTFFVVLGAVIVGVALLKGFDMYVSNDSIMTGSPPGNPPKLP
jgi:hypothetical protein